MGGWVWYWRSISSIFSRNSEAFASEILENIEEMLLLVIASQETPALFVLRTMTKRTPIVIKFLRFSWINQISIHDITFVIYTLLITYNETLFSIWSECFRIFQKSWKSAKLWIHDILDNMHSDVVTTFKASIILKGIERFENLLGILF